MSLTAKKVYAILNGKIVKINGIIETIKHPVIYQGSVKNESELPQNNRHSRRTGSCRNSGGRYRPYVRPEI